MDSLFFKKFAKKHHDSSQTRAYSLIYHHRFSMILRWMILWSSLESCGYELQNTMKLTPKLLISWDMARTELALEKADQIKVNGMLESIYVSLVPELKQEYDRLGLASEPILQICILQNSQADLQSYDRFGRLKLIQKEIQIQLKIEQSQVFWESQIQARHWLNHHQNAYVIQDQEQITRDEWYMSLKNALYEYLAFLKSKPSI